MEHSSDNLPPTRGTKTFDFFISYNQASAHELARDYYYTAIANGLHPWMDEVELPAGTNFHSAQNRGLKTQTDIFF